jgi:hypothetical protein
MSEVSCSATCTMIGWLLAMPFGMQCATMHATTQGGGACDASARLHRGAVVVYRHKERLRRAACGRQDRRACGAAVKVARGSCCSVPRDVVDRGERVRDETGRLRAQDERASSEPAGHATPLLTLCLCHDWARMALASVTMTVALGWPVQKQRSHVLVAHEETTAGSKLRAARQLARAAVAQIPWRQVAAVAAPHSRVISATTSAVPAAGRTSAYAHCPGCRFSPGRSA